MEGTDRASTESPIKGGIKIPVDVPPNARETLKPSPKVSPKPRERAHSVAAGSAPNARETLKPSPIKGGIKTPVDVPPNARETLKPSPKISPKPRERANSVAAGPASPNRDQGGQNGVTKSLVAALAATKKSDAQQWKTKALKYHAQVVQEIERLIQTVEDKEAANKAIDTLKWARIPQGNLMAMNVEKFFEKAEQVVTLLQRIQLQHPPVLQPPPT
jgi:hypothetical protein